MAGPRTLRVPTEGKPGEFVVRSLFAEFTAHAERKIGVIMAEPLERLLSKSLQRGEDLQFDQLLSTLSAVAEYCLPSLLRTLIDWYKRQNGSDDEAHEYKPRGSAKVKGDEQHRDRDYLFERRDLAIDFIFCLALIEILKQIPVHPVPDSLVHEVLTLAFKHFKYREGYTGPNTGNMHIIADLYAEVIGVLAQSKFQTVRKKFVTELRELRQKEPSPQLSQSIISLIMGLKFFRVKMYPVEEFEASFQFLQECAQYFLEVKDKDIKHALAGLFVEILVPVAATVKNEVNVPCLRNFVDMLYPTTFELSSRKKHSLALFPLVTCLLCVSQKTFFLSSWHIFLTNCLSHLKNKDPKMSRVALESLYRLLWVYMIRIKCESNTVTQSRLSNIVVALFPKGSRSVVPRDTPLNIFVKIIQFIAQERLDFAMKEIIFDLLSVGRSPKTFSINPERMNIGLRAFLVIADNLQQKDGEPPMPTTVGVMPSGNTLRVKKTFLSKTLTDEEARVIGMALYYPHVRRALDSMLRHLDKEVGRGLTLTSVQMLNKEPEDMITGERKPKIDLFRTCVAAIPRIIPEGMPRAELVEMLARLTIHMDEELRSLAFAALQSLVLSFPEWREEVFFAVLALAAREVPDTWPPLLDSCLRMLVQLLAQWRLATNTTIVRTETIGQQQQQSQHQKSTELPEKNPHSGVLHAVEGFALVMLCSCRPPTRRLAVTALREARALLTSLARTKEDEEAVIDLLDRISPSILESFLHLTNTDLATFVHAHNVDLQFLSDFHGPLYLSAYDTLSPSHVWVAAHATSGVDPWPLCLASFLRQDCLPQHCPSALLYAWPYVFTRLLLLSPQVDPNSPINTKKVSASSSTGGDSYAPLWRNYLLFCCSVAPASMGTSGSLRSSQAEALASTPDGSSGSESRQLTGTPSAVALFKHVVPFIRSESMDVTECLVLGLGATNPYVFRDLIEELNPVIKEALDRRPENVKRRRRRDVLRVQLVKMFELLADAGVFTHSASGGMDKDSQALGSMFVEYIDLTRALLESESDKDSDSLRDIRAHFSALLANILQNVRVEHRRNLFPQQSLRHSLFLLFSQWAGPFSVMFTPLDRYSDRHHQISRHQYSALKAMAAVLCCGPVFDNVGLSSDGYLYKWLDNILACHDARVHQLGSETVGLLLELNPDQGNLLNWVVDRCYTGSQRVSAGCFHAFTAAFTSRDYVVDPVTLLCLILFMISDTRRDIYETAMQLLQLCEAKLFHYAQKMEGRRGESQPLNLHTPLAHLYAASGLQLSEELAHAYPELTLSVFSEVSQRFPTAHPSGRQAMLAFLVPWLYNVELVDGRPPPAPPASYQAGPGTPESGSDCGIRPPEVCDTGQGYIRMASGSWHDETQGGRWLHGSGWGSVHASTFLLNNLMYITAKYGDDMVGGEMEAVWTTLANSWCHNQHVILQFLIALCGVRSDPLLLPYLKKVVIYLARDKPVQLLETFLAELQLTESVNSVLVHTDNPPYYRIAGMHKTPSIASGTTSSSNTIVPDGGDGMREVRRGKMHKESSFEDGTYLMADLYFGFNSSSIRPQHPRLESRYSNSSGGSYDEEKGDLVPPYVCWRMRLLESHRPESLPMPVSGGCWAPLIDYLPEVLSSGTPLHRSNVAVILMTDLVVDHGVGVDWASSLPLLLHAIILGLDHYRPEVYTHCRRLLLHLLLVLACPQSRVSISVALIRQRHVSEGRALRGPPSPATRDPLAASSHRFSDSQGSDSRLSIGSSCSTGAVPIAGPATGSGGPSLPALSGSMAPNDGEERSKEFIDFLISRKSGPLWSHEDIGPKHSTIRSAEQLGWFVCRLVDVFQHANPGLPLDQQLAHVALHTALSCSSRHYAARAFQTFRALRQPLGSIALSDLLARLVETVGDPSDETQGYVMEMMLTLEASVITIMESSKQADFLSALSRSTSPDPSVLHLKCAMNRRSTGHLSLAPAGGVSTLVGWFPFTSGHHRSNSVPKHVRTADRFADAPRRSATLDRLEARSANAQRPMALSCSLGKARSLGSLKEGQADSWAGAPAIGTGHSSNASGGSPGGSGDPTGLLVTIFWAAVALLESDYESEYSVALRLLDRLLSNGEIMPAGEASRLTLDRPAGLEKLEKVLTQLGWSGFPGVQALLLKGFTSAATLERTIHLLQKLTHVSRAPVFDMTQSTGFPLNVLCLLPHLVQNFDNPSDFCRRCADCIAQVCVAEKTTKLANLAHVMSLYRNGSYTRDSANWVSVVCRYLHDSFADRTFTLITYIAELLDKGLAILQPTLLQILLSLLSYADLLTVPAASFNQKVMKVIGKYVQSLQWREALNILKLVVSRSASLASPLETRASLALEPSVPLELSVHRVWNAGVKALPGKTLEFHFDVSETPVIGRKYAEQQGPVGHDGKPKAIAVTRSTSSTSSGSGSNALVPVSWKKPQLSQRRTREKLANVLSLCGQEVGLSKNPSVIFSSSGELELVETPPLGPSGEDVGGGDEAHEDTLSEQHFGVFKDFDFLDVELEEAEGESVDNFNWGVRRRSLDSLDKEGLPSLQECDFVCTTQGLDLNHPADTDESSDEELTTYSPTEESVLSQIEVAACEHLPNGLGTPASGTPAVGTPAGDSPSVDISLSEEHSVWEDEDILAKEEGGASEDDSCFSTHDSLLTSGEMDSRQDGGIEGNGSEPGERTETESEAGIKTDYAEVEESGECSSFERPTEMEGIIANQNGVIGQFCDGTTEEEDEEEEEDIDVVVIEQREEKAEEDILVVVEMADYALEEGPEGEAEETEQSIEGEGGESTDSAIVVLTETDEKVDDELEPEQAFMSSPSEAGGRLSSSSETRSLTPPPPFFPAILAAFRPPTCEDAEEAWKSHVRHALTDADGSCAVHTFQLFTAFFKYLQHGFRHLTYSVRNYLGGELGGLGARFLSSLDVLLSSADCPTVFVDAETLMSCDLLEKIKFGVLELQEHLDTYNCRKEATQQWLDDCLRTFTAPGSCSADGVVTTQPHSTLEKQMELCRRLYKLHFQFLLLFQSYCKLVGQVDAIKLSPDVMDLSSELTGIRQDLRNATAGGTWRVENENAEPDPLDTALEKDAPACPDAALSLMTDAMANGWHADALRLLRRSREHWPNDIFGSSNEDPVATLLSIHFRHLTLGQTGSLAVVGGSMVLSGACSMLMALNHHVLAALRGLRPILPRPEPSPSSSLG